MVLTELVRGANGYSLAGAFIDFSLLATAVQEIPETGLFYFSAKNCSQTKNMVMMKNK